MIYELISQLVLARALHPEQEEHGDDGEEGPHGVRHDELQRVVVRDQQDVQHRRRRKVTRQLDKYDHSSQVWWIRVRIRITFLLFVG